MIRKHYVIANLAMFFFFFLSDGVMKNLKINGILDLITHTLMICLHFPKKFHLSQNSVGQHPLRTKGLF